jgi:hypothetical protein
MIKLLLLLVTCTFVFASAALGQVKPTFSQYAVKVENLRSASVNLKSHRDAERFRTNLRNAARGRVNFAGHYILTEWGCGTNCSQTAIIDARNGTVYFPDELAGAVNGFCELPKNAEPKDIPKQGDTQLAPTFFKANSRLLLLQGFKGGDLDRKKARCGVYSLEWTGKQFRQVKFVPGSRTDTP